MKYFWHQIVGLSKEVIIHPEVKFSTRKIPEIFYLTFPFILMIKDDTGRLLDNKFKIGGGNFYNKSL